MKKHSREERDENFIMRPESWPAWPILPLKKVTGNYTDDDFCGVILAGAPLTVYITNMYAVVDGQVPDDAPRRIYESLDLLLQDWKVD